MSQLPVYKAWALSRAQGQEGCDCVNRLRLSLSDRLTFTVPNQANAASIMAKLKGKNIDHTLIAEFRLAVDNKAIALSKDPALLTSEELIEGLMEHQYFIDLI